ncbi:hypothetical protein [Gayadomonas joobiniege]|uniref:hypothetical protein n=1 Tax=Gayadomonas joobiniege TaxID=1234606 RepID=UPI000376C986|nr:hypothetical protein [Gayadomonas joobiniege]
MKIKLSTLAASLTLVNLFYAMPAKAAKTTYIPDGYSIKTISTPKDVRFHVTGMDSNNKGELFVATRFGDVWRYKKNNWLKVAEGLHEPTGLMCDQDGSIIVAHKPELTRLVDEDGDGVSDRYINMASGWDFHDNYHEFNFAPVKDKQGNYYGTLNLGHGVPDSLSIGAMDTAGGYRGWAYQVNQQGEFVPYAYGLRSPAGIGISPNNQVFFTDNQGDWVETSKLHLLKKDAFYGHPVSLRDHPDWTVEKILEQKDNFNLFDQMREYPVVWFPHAEVANSPGNPEWNVTKGKFGPFEGQIFIGDQTQSNIFRVILDEVNGIYQGAVINFIDGFQSGNIRTEFDNKGQLWVGQTARGWYSKGGKPFGLQKVVWDGTNPFEILSVKMIDGGFKVTLTEAMTKASAQKLKVEITEWGYKYSNRYGSPKEDEKSLPIKSLNVAEDGKSLIFTTDLTERKVIKFKLSGLKDAKGRSPSVPIVYYTVNQVK